MEEKYKGVSPPNRLWIIIVKEGSIHFDDKHNHILNVAIYLPYHILGAPQFVWWNRDNMREEFQDRTSTSLSLPCCFLLYVVGKGKQALHPILWNGERISHFFLSVANFSVELGGKSVGTAGKVEKLEKYAAAESKNICLLKYNTPCDNHMACLMLYLDMCGVYCRSNYANK